MSYYEWDWSAFILGLLLGAAILCLVLAIISSSYIMLSSEAGNKLCELVTNQSGSVALNWGSIPGSESAKYASGSLICRTPSYDSSKWINVIK